MTKMILCALIAWCAHSLCAQSGPVVTIDNISLAHEQRGWRVLEASTTPIRFNLLKGDLIVRIDGKNASETGPMLMANLFNQGYRRQIDLFIERGSFPMETRLRDIRAADYSPVGPNPFRHVANGFSAPEVELNDIDGHPLTLEQFKGKWVLIDFMATWCPPCMQALPDVLSAVRHEQLSLLTVAINDRAGSVRRMQQAYKIGSPIAMTSAMAQLPIDFGITTNRWTGQVPAFVLIRPDGEVELIEVGASDPHLEKTIQGLMSSSNKKDDDSK